MKAAAYAKLTEEQRADYLARKRADRARARAAMTPEQLADYRAKHNAEMRRWRANQSASARARRLARQREQHRAIRAAMTPEQRDADRREGTLRMRRIRAAMTPEQRADYRALRNARARLLRLERRLAVEDEAAAAARAAVPGLETRFDVDELLDVVDVARRHDEVVDLERRVAAARHRVAWITARRTVRALLVEHQQQTEGDADEHATAS